MAEEPSAKLSVDRVNDVAVQDPVAMLYDELRSQLTCTLCHGIFAHPVVNTMCGHVFCDGCINADIEGWPLPSAPPGTKAKKAAFQCPTCKLPCFKWALRPAAPIANALDAWRQMRAARPN